MTEEMNRYDFRHVREKVVRLQLAFTYRHKCFEDHEILIYRFTRQARFIDGHVTVFMPCIGVSMMSSPYLYMNLRFVPKKYLSHQCSAFQKSRL